MIFSRRFLSLRLLCLSLLIALLVSVNQRAVAQDPPPDKSLSFAGEYTIEGGYIDSTTGYQRTISIVGSNPIYGVTFGSDSGPTTTYALGLGSKLVDAFGIAGCTEVAYTRHTDGMMIGTWIDYNFGGVLALETLIPAAKTQDFAGAYRIVGAYGNGQTYEGTVVIAPGKDGLFNMKYHFPADATNPALDADALGIAIGNEHLGVVIQLAPNSALDKCALTVAQFDPNGNFNAFGYEYGKFASEKGTRTK
jgi:hypothetical protein